jgi:ferredoxin
MVRVSIDYKLCRGHQMCVLGVPSVFAVGPDEEGRPRLVSASQPDDRLEELLRAAASCPEQAIHIHR